MFAGPSSKQFARRFAQEVSGPYTFAPRRVKKTGSSDVRFGSRSTVDRPLCGALRNFRLWPISEVRERPLFYRAIDGSRVAFNSVVRHYLTLSVGSNAG